MRKSVSAVAMKARSQHESFVCFSTVATLAHMLTDSHREFIRSRNSVCPGKIGASILICLSVRGHISANNTLEATGDIVEISR